MFRFLVLCLFTAASLTAVHGQFQITEFLARNADGLLDENGETSDWVEIRNVTAEDQSIAGYYLTDDLENLTRWEFPAETSVPAGGFLIVFASGKNVGLHTNFGLAASTGSVLLVAPDGTTILDSIADYPEQRTDWSYGRQVNGKLRYFLEPTPGATNGDGIAGFVADTKFDHDRRFYDALFSVAITTATDGAKIYYTTDGSLPSAESGTLYAEPVPIDTTTTLRAIAAAEGMQPSNIDTQTYIFTAAVLRQSGDGLPDPPRPSTSDWDYDMDPDIVDDPRFATLEDDLKALRTLSIVLPEDDLWGRSRGIYANPTRQGAGWERACSIEILDPADPTANYQQDAGIRMQGAGSRFRNIGKKSMRLAFRSAYGEGKLRYSLFGDAHPSEFDTIVLRGSYFDSWTVHTAGSGAGIGWRNALQFRTDFGHQTHEDMGAHEILRDWVHVYLNGQYWGIYNIHERPDEEFAELHLGGAAVEYDVLKQRPRGQANGSSPELTNGDLDAWRELMQLVKRDTSDPAVYAEIQKRIELDPFIDYILVSLWGGNQDWPHNNWYAIRHKPTDGPFKFYNWDPENYIFDPNVNQVNVNTDNSPGIIYSRLRRNDEFKLRFADHVHRHCFNDGALTPEAAAARFGRIVNYLQAPMNAESARWGDERVRSPLNTIDTWLPTVDDKLQNYFPRRTNTVLSHLRSGQLYPRVVAPELNQHGGDIAPPFEATLEAPAGNIYYTLDGSDPREAPGPPTNALAGEGSSAFALVPSDGALGLAWTGVAFDPAGWKTGTTGIGFEAASGYEDLIGLEVSEMHNGNNSVYIRVPFQLPDQATIDGLGGLSLAMKYDDGFIAYLNGVQVTSKNAPADATWQSAATTSHSDSQAKEFEAFDISAHRALLVPGANVLAIQGMNQSGSNDVIISPQLSGGSSGATGGVSTSAISYAGGFTISETTTVKARVLDGDTWSALNEATFRVGLTPATATNLLVTEIHYRPAAPSKTELAAGFDDRDRFEFIELMNLGTTALDLGGARFARGIDFTFPERTTIPAGGRLVFARDAAALAVRYPGVAVAGQYTGSLSNGGERILLVDAADEPIVDLVYNDREPWPTSPDGAGFSLQLRDETVVPPDYSDAAKWRSSTALNGTPGGASAGGGFVGDPNVDQDGDELSALAEYAFGTSDADASELAELSLVTSEVDGLLLHFPANGDAIGVGFLFENSQDLRGWSSVAGEELANEASPDGRIVKRFRFATDDFGGAESFLRVRIVQL